MRATSEASLAVAQQGWEHIISKAGEQARDFGAQLYAVVDLLDATPSLRRALTDPSRSGDDKATLVTNVWADSLHEDVVSLLTGMARSRWSQDADLAESIDSLATTTILASAENANRFDAVEDELFMMNRLLARERELRLALSNKDLPASQRVALVHSLLSQKAAPETMDLIERLVLTGRRDSLAQSLVRIMDLAADRRRQKVATVTVATPITSEQTARLAQMLSTAYGREVRVNVAVEPQIVGGMRIQIGDEVVDATVLSRLEEVRRQLTGIQTS